MLISVRIIDLSTKRSTGPWGSKGDESILVLFSHRTFNLQRNLRLFDIKVPAHERLSSNQFRILRIILNMQLPVFVLLLMTGFLSPSTSTGTSDPSIFDITGDQLSSSSEGISSFSNPFDLVDTQIHPAGDQWNLAQDSPDLDLFSVDASCSDDAILPPTVKLRSLQ